MNFMYFSVIVVFSHRSERSSVDVRWSGVVCLLFYRIVITVSLL